MRIDIITLFPDFFTHFFKHSILQRAQKKQLVELHIHNLRDYSKNKQKSVDDYQFGGGSGMVMNIQPIDDCISKLKSEKEYDESNFQKLVSKKLKTKHHELTIRNKDIADSFFNVINHAETFLLPF